jgi:hypothetical protein
LPIYGDGGNVRDWLYVMDHCRAIWRVLEAGRPGEVYNVGGNSERTNLEVVDTLCALLDELLPDSPYRPHMDLKSFVKDRPGHDRRYAIDAGKLKRELGWEPEETFESGMRRRSTGIWTIRTGVGGSPTGAISASVSAPPARGEIMNRKGIILAGGSGTRLYPADPGDQQAALPVYDKPMIYYPLSTLMLAGIREILIISTPQDLPMFRAAGDGSQWGLRLSLCRAAPSGRAGTGLPDRQGLRRATASCLILGDNIFYGHGLVDQLKAAGARERGATVFGYYVSDPSATASPNSMRAGMS